MSGWLMRERHTPPPPDTDDPTGELPVYAGSVWAVPSPRPPILYSDVDLTAAINRVDYWIDRVEQAADQWRHAAYASYQAATRLRVELDRRRRRRLPAYFGASVFGFAAGSYLYAAGVVAYASGWSW